MGTLVKIEAEINFPEGKKTVQLVKKETSDVEDCEEGKIICLHLINGESLFGFFKGMADDEILIGSISGKITLGYNIYWVGTYFEEESQNILGQ